MGSGGGSKSTIEQVIFKFTPVIWAIEGKNNESYIEEAEAEEAEADHTGERVTATQAALNSDDVIVHKFKSKC